MMTRSASVSEKRLVLAADGLGGAPDGLGDLGLVEIHQPPVALLHALKQVAGDNGLEEVDAGGLWFFWGFASAIHPPVIPALSTG